MTDQPPRHLGRTKSKFREEQAEPLVLAVMSGETVHEAMRRLRVSKATASWWGGSYAQFDAVWQIAKFLGRIGPVADELDLPELRDLQGFAREVALKLLKEWK